MRGEIVFKLSDTVNKQDIAFSNRISLEIDSDIEAFTKSFESLIALNLDATLDALTLGFADKQKTALDVKKPAAKVPDANKNVP